MGKNAKALHMDCIDVRKVSYDETKKSYSNGNLNMINIHIWI